MKEGKRPHLYSSKLILILFVLWANILDAQFLQPGFSKSEYMEMLKIGAQFGDSVYASSFPAPLHHHLVYRSPVVGLDNRWELWSGDDHTAVISIRGTTLHAVSWLANFYAAMLPATGDLHLGDTSTFHYELSSNPRAAVHAGWLLGMAFLARDILPRLDSCYKKGIRQFVVTGHSQGGGISYLLTAYLYHLQMQHRLGNDIRFKTYCSAAPKPGNLYFAYEYEAMTQEGWAYNVVNAVDWVPQMPMGVQTTDDFNTINPFLHLRNVIRQQTFPKNLALMHAYNRLDKPPKRARKNYGRYLGKMMEKMVKKIVPGYKAPAYFNSNDYVRTGAFVVMMPDEDYYRLYPNDHTQRIFIHHLHRPYLYLAEKLK